MNCGVCGTIKVPRLPRCRCGSVVVVRFAERQGEGEHPATGELESSASFEAWIECRRCGPVSWLSGESWSEEVFDDRELGNGHIKQAVAGCCKVWREQRQVETAEAAGG
jgi:hypothetical protein